MTGDSVTVVAAQRPHRVPHQLPRPAAAFTGRDQELAELLDLLAPEADARQEPLPVLVTGMAGVGKSALVVQAAHSAVRRGWFPGGTVYLNLGAHHAGNRPVRPADALESALFSLDVDPRHIPVDLDGRAAAYRTALARLPGPLLLILEDATDSQQVAPLLSGDPRHRIVITSRKQLLSLIAHPVTVNPLARADAVRLLDTVLQSVAPGDSRVRADPRAAEAVVASTGGLPLALAIIARRLTVHPSWPLARVAEELTGSGDARERLERLGLENVGVATAIESSYRELSGEDARLLSTLALTVGPRFSTATVAAGLGTGRREAQGLLDRLLEAHLVEETEQDRWQLHSLIRDYATAVADDVIDATELELVRDRILDFTLRHSDPADDGSGLFTTRVGTRPLAGVHGDGPSAEDRLGVVHDVEVLADLIAAAETRPPLSIALIGNWGAGKSSVMLQIERQVRLLARLSRGRPGRSAFVSSVRQVRFNAWHYSDTNVWTGLITHLFTALAGGDEDETTGPAPDPRQARRDRDTLRAALDQRESSERQLADRLAAADLAMPAAGRFAPLGSPMRSYRVLLTAVRQTVRDLRVGLPVLALWLLLAGGATGVWLWRGALGGLVAGVLALAAAAAPARPLLRRLRSAHQDLLGLTERRYGELAAQQRALRAEINGLRERLALVDAAARLGKFLEERADGTAYQPYRGVLGQAHADLLRLGLDLEAARLQWQAGGAVAAPPLERIVLYIDDLDRCPPDRVVEVLQAVHLMLGLDLFVVVVAVDARWLIHSLRHHHNALFQHEDASDATGTAPDIGGLATAVDYLDKIFQIPYALNPPPPQTMARYLRSLLPDPQAEGAERPDPDSLPPTEGYEPDTREGTPPPPGEDALDGTPAAVPGPAPGAVRGPAPEPADLLPPGLRIGTAEITFMTRLGALLPTPRAAKRLVNLYRLVRIGVPATDLPAFASSSGPAPFQAVQILLAVLAGSPRAAEELFRRLLACQDDDTALADLCTRSAEGPQGFDRLARALPGVLRDLSADQEIPLTVGHYRRWCADLTRYSFHTRGLAAHR
ncbi:P-loop NTPase fold protein [Streptomyces fuscichromogenes]|uniref:P-loop NTPase fold protein n=1 Tax=Streptomyces fuscichromogenes TaxID=1324013 RepID=UPI0016716BD4|nr:P-loop NTPase fold protein [Streptomyces fuscichromogenes]